MYQKIVFDMKPSFRIDLIKWFRQISILGLKECKDFTDWGVVYVLETDEHFVRQGLGAFCSRVEFAGLFSHPMSYEILPVVQDKIGLCPNTPAPVSPAAPPKSDKEPLRKMVDICHLLAQALNRDTTKLPTQAAPAARMTRIRFKDGLVLDKIDVIKTIRDNIPGIMLLAAKNMAESGDIEVPTDASHSIMRCLTKNKAQPYIYSSTEPDVSGQVSQPDIVKAVQDLTALLSRLESRL